MSKLLKKDEGFTLIEIVLVLAIAGLILLIVFLAVTGAQKSRRDTQRKNDVSRMASQVENFAGNNGGSLPTAAQLTASPGGVICNGCTYYDSHAQPDPSGTDYTVVAGAPASAGQLRYQLSTFCPGVAGTAGARNYALTVYLEQGGSYCVDNH